MVFGRSILLAAARSRRLNDFALRSAFVKRATRTFMPDEHADDALEAGAAIATSGRGVIFTQLGEAIASAEAAVLVRDHYLRLFDQIRATGLPAEVSVKPTQLGLDLSFAECERHLRLLRARVTTGGRNAYRHLLSRFRHARSRADRADRRASAGVRRRKGQVSDSHALRDSRLRPAPARC